MRIAGNRPAVIVAAMSAFGVGCGGEIGFPFTPRTPKPPLAPVSTGFGDVKVTTRTSGANVDPDGYVIRVNGYWDYDHEPTAIPANGTVTLRFLTPGVHTLSLDNVDVNCRGEKLEDRAITVTSDSTIAVEFQVECE